MDHCAPMNRRKRETYVEMRGSKQRERKKAKYVTNTQREVKDRKKENYNELTKTLKKTVFKKKDAKSILRKW